VAADQADQRGLAGGVTATIGSGHDSAGHQWAVRRRVRLIALKFFYFVKKKSFFVPLHHPCCDLSLLGAVCVCVAQLGVQAGGPAGQGATFGARVPLAS